MLFIALASILLSLIANSVEQNPLQPSQVENITRNFIYNRFEYKVRYVLTVNSTTEQIIDFYEDSDDWLGYPTRVHVSTNDSVTGDHPIFITATQQKGISSWELPLEVRTAKQTLQFTDMARTLCPHDAGPNITTISRPLVQITTSSPTNLTLDIKLRRVEDFYIEVDKEIYVESTPGTPKYYYFSFDSDPLNVTKGRVHSLIPSFNYTIPKSIILMIESDDDLCAIVSIQNNSCPVFDNEREVRYRGYHLTMTTKGGITLTQSMFPTGFYVVFLVKQTDEECNGDIAPSTHSEFSDEFSEENFLADSTRLKKFRFRVIATISYWEYLTGSAALLALMLLVWAMGIAVSYCSCACSEEVLVFEPVPGPSTSNPGEINNAEITPIIVAGQDDFDSEDENLVNPDTEMCSLRALSVADLCKVAPAANNRRSDRYFWNALTVSVVYALPVVQLLVTYQNMTIETGNQDVCYYNFLCAHPLGPLADYNHVFSNAGYVLLGVAFMLQVRARARRTTLARLSLGIPQHTGLFYSMGLALVMEGLLSACYHLCPNKMNFQFDSSFMYVTAVLVMVKLYQNRHADVNARAHTTFMVLALLMAVGLFGILYPSVGFWVVFTALHLATCFFLTLNIYYVGRFKFERQVAKTAWVTLKALRHRALIPDNRARAILLAIANAANWALAAHGVYEHNKDFARHLLAILMGNAILYTMFYIAMKLVHRERVPLYCWVYLTLATVSWGLAISFFLDSRTKWSLTPSGSRRHNAVCSAMSMFDTHDAWHSASAAALYFSLCALFTVDDALADTPRHRIPVF